MSAEELDEQILSDLFALIPDSSPLATKHPRIKYNPALSPSGTAPPRPQRPDPSAVPKLVTPPKALSHDDLQIYLAMIFSTYNISPTLTKENDITPQAWATVLPYLLKEATEKAAALRAPPVEKKNLSDESDLYSSALPKFLNLANLPNYLHGRLLNFGRNNSDLVGKYFTDCFERITNPHVPAHLQSGAQQALLTAFSQIAQVEKHTENCFIMLDNVSDSFISGFLQADSKHVVLFQEILVSLSKQTQRTKAESILNGTSLRFWKRIHRFSSIPAMMPVFQQQIEKEIQRSKSCVAKDLEKDGLFPGFLLVDTFPTNPNPAFPYFETMVKGFPDSHTREDMAVAKEQISKGLSQGIDCMHIVFKKILLNKSLPLLDTMLQWFSSVISLNEARTDMDLKDPLSYQMRNMVFSSDSFLINFSWVLLKFCQPFLAQEDRLDSIAEDYPWNNQRFDFSRHKKLCPPTGLEQKPEQKSFDFISEIFFNTAMCNHVSYFSTLKIWIDYSSRFYNIRNKLDALKKQHGSNWSSIPALREMSQNVIQLCTIANGYDALLFYQPYLDLQIKFYYTLMVWLLRLKAKYADEKGGVQVVFSQFPEFLVRDCADFVNLILRCKPTAFDNSRYFLTLFLDWCLEFLDPGLAASPVVRAKIMKAMAEILFYKDRLDQNPSRDVNAKATYEFIFQANKKIQTASAIRNIMRIYIDVDIVEGLDVDKESFDKYLTRKDVAALLNTMWAAPTFKLQFLELVESKEFLKFIGVVITDSIFLLEDSLGRLVDIKQLQEAMANTTEWNKQDLQVIQERTNYLHTQESSAKSFLSMALSALDLLLKVTSQKQCLQVFLQPDLLVRVVAMLNHFFDALVGPKCGNLNVQDPQKYNFHPRELLKQIVLIHLAFVDAPEYAPALVMDMDYSPEIFQRALVFLKRERIVSQSDCSRFETFLGNAQNLVQKMDENRQSSTALSTCKLLQGLKELPAAKTDLEELYKKTMGPLNFGCIEIQKSETEIHHHYAENIKITGNLKARSQKMEKLMKEIKGLPANLPISLGSAILVRTDESRLDVMKAIITGPEGTPYGFGCFQFDIFFTNNYPLEPPLCNLETTGNGTVRFNPNLYNCGKVCLSLLGTWYGDGHQSSKWNPATSSLYQVLLSIQAFILVEEPYYNEPAYTAQQGTVEGKRRSAEYNDGIRLATLRHAILGQLRHPTEGFEEAIYCHFRLQRDRVLEQVNQWVSEASSDVRPKMEQARTLLQNELKKLQ